MDKLMKSNGKFMASDDGTIAGLIFSDFNELFKFLRMYNSEPETTWFDLAPHKDETSGLTYDSALCYVTPTEYRHCTNCKYSIEGAVIVAFYNAEIASSAYVVSDVVLAALGERQLTVTGG